MESPQQMRQLLGLADVLTHAHRPEVVLETALPRLLGLGAADAVMVVDRGPEGLRVAHRYGSDLDARGAVASTGDPAELLVDCTVPETWDGISRVEAHVLPGGSGTLVLAWGAAPDPEQRLILEMAVRTVDAWLSRSAYEERLSDLTVRVDNAQQLANMGDYDWHIVSDTNTWSDQLFRIYGHEPQSFMPSYDQFLSMIHPDDRERIAELHQRAYATGEPYRMIERIVRADGQVRFLSSNGEVILDDDSIPVRMRGTCVDVTEKVMADRERARIAARFHGLVDSAPDAILVLGEDQKVLEANPRAHELLGGDPQGHGIEEILPGWPTSGTTDVHTHGFDGSGLRLDVTTVDVHPTEEDTVPGVAPGPEDTLVAVFLRDARTRLEREAMAAKLGEAQLRRRQALEINDNLVQGLVAALYAQEMGKTQASTAFLGRTLTAARAMMDDLLEPLDGEGLQPGDLVRSSAAVIGEGHDTSSVGRGTGESASPATAEQEQA
jgi:PAS domain S-box-containing protein